MIMLMNIFHSAVSPNKIRGLAVDEQASEYVHQIKDLLKADRSAIAIQPNREPLFFIQFPRWPIKSILLVVRGSQADRSAIEFAVCLASKCPASLVTLAAVPDIPAFYRSYAKVQLGLPTLFELNTEPGHQLREILQRMRLHDINGDIQACECEPNQQIRQLVKLSDPDLIVISQEPYSRLWRLLFGEIVKPLLHWIDRPVLIA
jgi:nucleotide-binding universal stress UspA family protein